MTANLGNVQRETDRVIVCALLAVMSKNGCIEAGIMATGALGSMAGLQCEHATAIRGGSRTSSQKVI